MLAEHHGMVRDYFRFLREICLGHSLKVSQSQCLSSSFFLWLCFCLKQLSVSIIVEHIFFALSGLDTSPDAAFDDEYRFYWPSFWWFSVSGVAQVLILRTNSCNMWGYTYIKRLTDFSHWMSRVSVVRIYCTIFLQHPLRSLLRSLDQSVHSPFFSYF